MWLIIICSKLSPFHLSTIVDANSWVLTNQTSILMTKLFALVNVDLINRLKTKPLLTYGYSLFWTFGQHNSAAVVVSCEFSFLPESVSNHQCQLDKLVWPFCCSLINFLSALIVLQLRIGDSKELYVYFYKLLHMNYTTREHIHYDVLKKAKYY